MCPVKYRDAIYPSQSALARQLGISTGRVSYTLDRDGHLENLNTSAPRKGSCLPKPCWYRDRQFPSQVALADHLGVSPSVVTIHLKRYGHCANIGVKQHTGFRPITIAGIWFPSQQDAARTLDVTETIMSNYARGVAASITAAQIESAAMRAFSERRLMNAPALGAPERGALGKEGGA